MLAVRRLALLLTASPLAIALATAASADVAPIPGHFTLQGFGGDDQGGAFSAWMPVIQAPGTVVWASPYAVFGDNATSAGFGLGYRAIVSPTWAVGTYAFIDGSAGTGEDWLWQGALGVEALSSEVQARANVYVPLSGSTRATAFDSAAATLNADHMLELNRAHRYGAYGVDGEFGYRLLKWGTPDSGDGLRGFAGAYTSWRDGNWRSGFQGRLEAKFTSKTSGVALKLSAAVGRDDRAATQWVVGAGLTLPLGPASTLGGGGDDGVATPPLDNDPVHHLGALNIVVEEAEAAYYLNGRATGLVQYADGNGGPSEDGWSAPNATSLVRAVDNAGVNGVVVALGQDGDIETEGQTLLAGQALIGGGAYLPLMAADGTTGFYWHADGTQGTIDFYNPAGGYALTLADYNSVIGTKIVAYASYQLDNDTIGAIDGIGKRGLWITDNDVQSGAVSSSSSGGAVTESLAYDAIGSNAVTPAVGASEVYGINLTSAIDATVANNSIDVQVTATGGTGGNATAAPNLGNLATGGDSGVALSASTVVGLVLDGSTDANVYGNDVAVTVTATSGDGGFAIAGSASDLTTAAGTATGGNAGAAIGGSSIYGISLASAGSARIADNEVTVDVTATGGAGGEATIASGSSQAMFAGGASIGGGGGYGLSQSAVSGIFAGAAQPGVVISNNTVDVTVHATGGAGGEGTGGQGGSGDDGGAGGTGTGGAGGYAIAENVSISGIDVNGGDGPSVTGNSVTMELTSTGGRGGEGTGGTGSAGDDSTGSGGTGTGGRGGEAFGGFSQLAGLDFSETTSANIADNTVLITASTTGGMGGTGNGGGTINFDHSVNGKGGDALGGTGGDGVIGSTIVGEYGALAQHARLTGETITVNATVLGGAGGTANGTSGGYVSSPGAAATPGVGGSGTAGDGGNAMEHAVVYGLELGQSNDTLVAGASILVSATATGGVGGRATGGAGGYGDDGGSAGGAADGGDGGAGATTASFVALAGELAQQLTISDLSSTLSVTVTSGNGGAGDGGDGGTSVNAFGGAGGAGTGGDGGEVLAFVANIDLLSAADVMVTNSLLDTTVTIAAGDGGKGTGGNGGESDTGTGGAGGPGTGGTGADLGQSIDPLFVAVVVVDNAANVSLISGTGDFTVGDTAGDGGDAQGGNGGFHNGAAGTATSGAGGATHTHTDGISFNGGTTGLIVDDFGVNQNATTSSGNGGTAIGGVGGAP